MSVKTSACATCGAAITYDTRTVRFQRYCSIPCRNAAAKAARISRAGSERRCARCGETKPIKDFSGLITAYCRPCHATRARERRPLRTPEQRERDRMQDTAWRNGISPSRLREVFDGQAGLCAICRSRLGEFATGKWHIDHDHSCCAGRTGGKRRRSCGRCIRGVLCGHCNVGLGMFRDNPEFLAAAIAYLAKPGSTE